MKSVKVGDIVRHPISTSCTKGMDGICGLSGIIREGKVVFVDPKGRFYTAEFKLGNRSLRESYLLCPGSD